MGNFSEINLRGSAGHTYTYRIIRPHNPLLPLEIREFKSPHHDRHDGHELQIRKLLPDAPVPTRSERKVRTRRARGHEAVPVVHLDAPLLVAAVVVVEVRARVPAMRVPALGVGKVLRAAAEVPDGGEEGVGFGDVQVGAGDGDGSLRLAHQGVDGRVQAEGLAHDVGVQGQSLQVVQTQRRVGGVQGVELLPVELRGDPGLRGQVQHYPGARHGGGGLPGHQEGDHQVRDLLVR